MGDAAAVRTVDVFFRDTASLEAAGQPPDVTILSPAERERAGRFHFDRDRKMFIASHATLRRLLSKRTGENPETLKFEFGARGKPALPGTGISFNLSHAGTWFACAISTGAPIGIDIEHVHPLEDMLAMAHHFFAPSEVEHLFTVPEARRTDAFFECWTRKEAIIKTTGEGVSRPLDSFEVSFGSRPPKLLRLDNDLDPRWHMRSFNPAPQYVAALASSEDLGIVRTHFL